MFHNDIPFKVAVGYGVVAIVLILAISLIYSNTKSVVAINQASREYMQKRDAADSTISALLKEEQRNLQQLSDAMNGNGGTNYLRDKVRSLNNGEDSIVVHPKMRQTQQAKKHHGRGCQDTQGILQPSFRCVQERTCGNHQRED